jgi:hypothetical protein
VYTINNGLTPQALDNLRTYIATASSWSIVDGQNDLNRRKITWDPDTIIEELHIAFENLTPLINGIFTGKEKHFDGIQLWKDEAGYFIGYHTDNSNIAVSMQWYLFDNVPVDCGTTFVGDTEEVIVPYVANTGYLAADTSQITHKTTNSTPPGIIRYSLYAVWTF